MIQIVYFMGNVATHQFVIAIMGPLGPHIVERFHHTLQSCLAAAMWWDKLTDYYVACIGR